MGVMALRSAAQALWSRLGGRTRREEADPGAADAWINGPAAGEQWVEEDQWLAGLPLGRTEQFGRLWWQYS
jgi:RecB family exonuclease